MRRWTGEVRVAGAPLALPAALQGGLRVAAVHSPATAVGDLADLLDVDVDHVSGCIVLVSLHLAGVLAGGWVNGAESVEAASDEDPVHGGGRDADAFHGQLAADAVGSVLGGPAELLDAVLVNGAFWWGNRYSVDLLLRVPLRCTSLAMSSRSF